MDKRLIQDFDKWNNANHRNAIENNGCCVWHAELTELPMFEGRHPRVSIVFSRYQGNQTNTTDIMYDDDHAMGRVVAIPSYWLDVDHLLATIFISNFVDDFINQYYPSYGDGSGGGSGSGGDCPICPDDCPTKPPCPPPMPPRPPFPGPVTPPGVPPAFNDHISPVGPPGPPMSPPSPVDPGFNVQG